VVRCEAGLDGIFFHNNRELVLVLVLLYIWKEGKKSYLHDNLNMERIDLWKDSPGNAKELCQELQNVVTCRDLAKDATLHQVWRAAERDEVGERGIRGWV
jgi:hypothetical protein